jgi:hypothetical protein
MSEVFREVTFEWAGEDCTVTPSMALLKRIKAMGINNLALAKQCLHGGADPIDLAMVHRAFMKEAGVSLSEEESYGFIMGGSPSVQVFQMA